jgi:hypothetical protein
MTRILYSFLIAAAIAARAVGAQETFEGIDRAAAVQLGRIVQEVADRGLPSEPIVAMARHGVQMKVPSPRIVTAARAVATRLAQARDALTPSAPTEADIRAGENALSAGVSAGVLRRIRAESPHDPVVIPLGVVAQLVANHVSEGRAASMVIELMKRQATPEQIASYGNNVSGDIALGSTPDVAADIRLRGLIPQIGPPGSFGFPGGDKVTVPAATTGPPPPPPGKPPVKKP